MLVYCSVDLMVANYHELREYVEIDNGTTFPWLPLELAQTAIIVGLSHICLISSSLSKFHNHRQSQFKPFQIPARQ